MQNSAGAGGVSRIAPRFGKRKALVTGAASGVRTVALLASDDASFITRAAMTADGGYTAI